MKIRFRSYIRQTNMTDDVTWNTLGALTSEARADERVAENMPAVMRGPNPDTKLITLQNNINIKPIR